VNCMCWQPRSDYGTRIIAQPTTRPISDAAAAAVTALTRCRHCGRCGGGAKAALQPQRMARAHRDPAGEWPDSDRSMRFPPGLRQ
jgi:hypothetical protein